MKLRVMLLTVAVLQTFNVYAESFSIGQLEVALGADQAQTVKAIKARYEVIGVDGQPNTFFISERKRPDVRVIGGVSFKDGKLNWATRNWGHFVGSVDGTEVSKALQAAVESALSATNASAVVTVKTQKVPNAEFNTLTLQFLNRKVVVVTSEGDLDHGGKQVTIDESIRYD